MRHLVWVVLSACVIVPSSQQPQYAQAPAQQQPAPGQPQTSDCVLIFQCMASCNGDNLCHLQCLQRGSPEGRQNATALIQCGQANGCAPEAQCLWQRCETESRTCQGNTELPPELQKPQDAPPPAR
jgi:hypothetical protein